MVRHYFSLKQKNEKVEAASIFCLKTETPCSSSFSKSLYEMQTEYPNDYFVLISIPLNVNGDFFYCNLQISKPNKMALKVKRENLNSHNHS